MDSQRNLLLIALLFVSFMIWQAWHVDNAPQPVATQTTQQTANPATGDAASSAVPGSGQGKLITVNTDVLSLTINTRGGDIEQAKLLAYPDTLGSSTPFTLLESTPSFVYQAQSGLTGRDGPDNPANGERPLFEAAQDTFTLADGQDELRIPLTFTGKDGSVFTKTFVLKRNHYAVGVDYSIVNKSATPLELTLFGQLKQTTDLPKHRDTGSNNFALHTFRGAAYSSSEDKYQKYAFDKDESLNVTTQGGWIAMLQQYFATAWVPQTQGVNTFYTSKPGTNLSAIGFKAEPVIVQPGAEKQLNATLWVGPLPLLRCANRCRP